MKKNITLRIDAELLKRCRYEAVEHDTSLSQWAADVLEERVKQKAVYQQAKKRAIKRLHSGFSLGGEIFNRSELHER
jgi:predicted NUDIX family phosphoesterase